MKILAKLICFGVTLAWMQAASAATTGTNGKPAQGVPKKPAVSRTVHDRATVEQRINDNAALTKKRSDVAKKAAKPQPTQPAPAK
jgi:hypothetical protein